MFYTLGVLFRCKIFRTKIDIWQISKVNCWNFMIFLRFRTTTASNNNSVSLQDANAITISKLREKSIQAKHKLCEINADRLIPKSRLRPVITEAWKLIERMEGCIEIVTIAQFTAYTLPYLWVFGYKWRTWEKLEHYRHWKTYMTMTSNKPQKQL